MMSVFISDFRSPSGGDSATFGLRVLDVGVFRSFKYSSGAGVVFPEPARRGTEPTVSLSPALSSAVEESIRGLIASGLTTREIHEVTTKGLSGHAGSTPLVEREAPIWISDYKALGTKIKAAFDLKIETVGTIRNFAYGTSRYGDRFNIFHFSKINGEGSSGLVKLSPALTAKVLPHIRHLFDQGVPSCEVHAVSAKSQWSQHTLPIPDLGFENVVRFEIAG